MLFVGLIFTSSVMAGPATIKPLPWSEDLAIKQEKHLIKNVDCDRLWEHTAYLASPELRGRHTGDIGQYKAGIWIAKEFDKYGLVPLNELDPSAPITPEPDIATMHIPEGYPTPTKYTDWAAMGVCYYYPPVDLTWIEEGKTYTYGAGHDYQIFDYSGYGDVTAEVVFVGYGITLPEMKYDDYASVDVKGKIVLCMRHGPNHITEGWHPPTWSFGWKAWNALQHGAAGFILVSDPRVHPMDAGSGTLTATYYNETMPAVWASTYTVGADLMPTGTFEELLDLEIKIDDWVLTGEPYEGEYSFETGKTFHLEVHGEYDPNRATFNVIGVLPGQVEPDKYVIVSAHYDHLGAYPTGEVCAGADDDASGVACMLEVARIMTKLAVKPYHSVIFAAWTGEEEGLWGSWDFFAWENTTWTTEHIVAVVQMDMVGLGDPTLGLNIFGGNDFPDFFETFEEASTVTGIPVHSAWAGSASDHYSFVALEIPAVMLQPAGPHPYYHTPLDTPETIDPYELMISTRMAGLVAWAYANPVDGQPLPIRGR